MPNSILAEAGVARYLFGSAPGTVMSRYLRSSGSRDAHPRPSSYIKSTFHFPSTPPTTNLTTCSIIMCNSDSSDFNAFIPSNPDDSDALSVDQQLERSQGFELSSERNRSGPGSSPPPQTRAWVDGCMDVVEVRDLGRLRTVKISDPDGDNTNTDRTCGARQAIRSALRARNQGFAASGSAISLAERPWQVAAAAELMCGRDVLCCTATGSGKTMCIFLPLMANPASIVMVVSPLIALMDDQTEAAAELGFTAIQLTDKTMKEQPNIIARAVNGEFQVVLVQPEFCVGNTPKWKPFCDPRTPFWKRLSIVMIDEAHLIHAWYVENL
jgi:hypothetical protein